MSVIKNKYYAGIGSRETPPDVLIKMQEIAAYLGRRGWTLRSGGAESADTYFEIGCDEVKGKKEIYLPWKLFNDNKSPLLWSQCNWDLAKEYHPNWENLSLNARILMARNSAQVLGLECNSPVDFIVCWTKDGLGGGGTGQALRIAKDKKIPIYDLGKKTALDKLRKLCKTL